MCGTCLLSLPWLIIAEHLPCLARTTCCAAAVSCRHSTTTNHWGTEAREVVYYRCVPVVCRGRAAWDCSRGPSAGSGPLLRHALLPLGVVENAWGMRRYEMPSRVEGVKTWPDYSYSCSYRPGLFLFSYYLLSLSFPLLGPFSLFSSFVLRRLMVWTTGENTISRLSLIPCTLTCFVGSIIPYGYAPNRAPVCIFSVRSSTCTVSRLILIIIYLFF